MKLATAEVDLVAGTAKFTRDINSAVAKFESAGRKMQRVGKNLTARVSLPVLAVGAASVKMASDAEEAANKFDVVMGSAAESVRARFEDLHDTIPLTTAQVEGLSAGIQDMLVPMGVARVEAAGMSADMVELAADLGSFNNVNPAQVLEAMQSALAGASEPMRRYGVDTRVARLESIALREGLIAAGEAMDQTAMAQAVLIAVQQDSTDAMGDAARTADSTANMMKFLWRDLEELAIVIGQELIPVVRPMLARMIDVVRGLREMDPATQRVILGIAGLTAVVGPALVVLGTLLKSLAGIALVLNPAGALIAGVLALTTYLGVRYVKAAADAAQETRELEEALATAGTEMRQLDEAAQIASLKQFQRGALQAKARVAEIRAEMEKFDSGAWRDMGIPLTEAQERAAQLKAELSAAQQRQQEMTALAVEATAALTDEAEAAEAVTNETNDAVSAIEDRVSLLSEALDLEVEGHGVMEEALAVQAELRSEIDNANLSLTERVALMREELTIAESIRDALLERAGDPGKGGLVNAGGVPTAAPTGDFRNVSGLADLLDDSFAQRAADLAKDTANSFEMNWSAAISVIGAQLGGIASQAANVATAFMSGGASAGIPALIGAVGGMIGGGSAAATQEEYNRALDEFVQLGQQASQAQQQLNRTVSEAASTLMVGFEAVTGMALEFEGQMPRTRAELDAFIANLRRLAEQAGVSGPALEAEIATITAAIEQHVRDMVDSFREELDMRLLVAQGRDEEVAALRLQIERQAELAQALELGGVALAAMLGQVWAAEDAARAAAEAEAELARQRKEAETQASLAARAAALWGSEMDAVRASAEAAALAERNRAQEAYEAGRISIETLNQWLEVIDGEYTATIRSAAQAIREAAQAERERMRDMNMNLRLRLLEAQGADAAANALRDQIEVNAFLARGADDATLALLRQVQAAEAQADAAREAESQFRSTANEMERMGRATVANAPTAFRLSLREFQASGPGTNTGMTRQVDQSTNTYHISIAADGRDPATLVDLIASEIQKRQRSGSSNPLRVRVD